MKKFNIKLFNINEDNIDNFFKLVEECKGKVELVSDGYGFRVDLKSKLAQYVSIAKIFMNKEVEEVELIISEAEDASKFLRFMFEGK
jgi:hypothetical protein